MLARILEGRFSVSRWLADAAEASIANNFIVNLSRPNFVPNLSCAGSAATAKSPAAHQALVRATSCFLAIYKVFMPNQNETILKCACLAGFFLRFEAFAIGALTVDLSHRLSPVSMSQRSIFRSSSLIGRLLEFCPGQWNLSNASSDSSHMVNFLKSYGMFSCDGKKEATRCSIDSFGHPPIFAA